VTQRKSLVFLRIFFFGAAFGWGSPFLGVFIPWPWLSERLFRLGGAAYPSHPMVDYWWRMACATYGFVGVFYFLLGLNPRRYRAIIPFSAWLMIGMGVLLLAHGFRLGLEPFPFLADVVFCLGIGTGILFQWRPALSDTTPPFGSD
jgi:hypothetical protein